MEPCIYHLSTPHSLNPASFTDCFNASLRDCVERGVRLYGWRRLMFSACEETVLDPVSWEDCDDDLLQDAQLDNWGLEFGDGITIRRIMTHAMVIAIASDREGRHIAEFIECRALPAGHLDAFTIAVTPEAGEFEPGDEDEEEELDDEIPEELEKLTPGDEAA
jgi:hypothetical protein